MYQLKETNQLFWQLNIQLQYTFLLYASQRGNNWLKRFFRYRYFRFAKAGMEESNRNCPTSFPVDNLETLFDIDIQARKLFVSRRRKVCLCSLLNNSDEWIEAIWKITVGFKKRWNIFYLLFCTRFVRFLCFHSAKEHGERIGSAPTWKPERRRSSCGRNAISKHLTGPGTKYLIINSGGKIGKSIG